MLPNLVSLCGERLFHLQSLLLCSLQPGVIQVPNLLQFTLPRLLLLFVHLQKCSGITTNHQNISSAAQNYNSEEQRERRIPAQKIFQRPGFCEFIISIYDSYLQRPCYLLYIVKGCATHMQPRCISLINYYCKYCTNDAKNKMRNLHFTDEN